MPNWATIDFVNKRHEHVNVQLGVWGEYRTVNRSNAPGMLEFHPHWEKLMLKN